MCETTSLNNGNNWIGELECADSTVLKQIELTSPAASEQSRADCEAICKLNLNAKVGRVHPLYEALGNQGLDFDPHSVPHGRRKDSRSNRR